MALDPYDPPVRAGGPSFRAWAYLIIGSVLIIGGVVLPGVDKGELNTPRAFLFAGGLVALGAAVARRLQTASQDLEARIGSASLLLTASFGVWLAYLGMPNRLLEAASPDRLPGLPMEREWDSMRMALMVLGVVTLAAAVLVLLPVVARKVVVSLLILLHFGNILVSVTSVPPPSGPAPWLSVQAWAYFYRPYSSFMYLSNAYHFYSPEPGPPTLAWFYVCYSDDSGRWIKLPSHNDSPVPIHYQRLLALTESINAIDHNTPPNYNDLATARRLAGKIREPEIPLPLDLAPTIAYQPPENYSRVMVSAYARYVARHWPHPDDNPNAEVKTVKVYRLIHGIISAPQIVKGLDANDQIFDLPYFMGEFDPKGEMLDPNDPFLYFLLPITRDPEPAPEGSTAPPKLVLHNSLEAHATTRTSEKEPQP
jgi:hypothetical protein